MEDLDAAAGGFDWSENLVAYGSKDDDRSNCVQYHHRPVYGPGGFPSCAATVESGSNCNRNDGCYSMTVVYDGMTTDCGRTWR